MTFPVRWSSAHPKSETPPVSVQRGQKRKAKKEALGAAYELVNQRDGNRCRVTGKPLDPRASDPAHRREHHHLRGRRVRPDWRERPERICLVSTLAHDCINNGWLIVEGDDARKPLFFHWAPHVKPKMRPFVIKRHNKTNR